MSFMFPSFEFPLSVVQLVFFEANIEFTVPYSQRYLHVFSAIPYTNHNANHNRKGNPNPTNPNTRYRCEYGTLNSMFAFFDTI